MAPTIKSIRRAIDIKIDATGILLPNDPRRQSMGPAAVELQSPRATRLAGIPS
jgi:hypothetical protein